MRSICSTHRSSGRLLRAGIRWAAVALGAVGVLGYTLYAGERAPDDAPPVVRREVADTLRASGERVDQVVPVVRRRWTDYYRATRGVLVATDRRLLFIGASPAPLTPRMSEDEPMTLTEHSGVAYDSVTVAEGRTLFGRARGIAVRSAEGRELFQVPERAWPEAERLLLAVSRHQADLREAAERAQRAREAAEALARLPVYHVVVRGDALESLARMYGTTVEQIRALNGLSRDRIRTGESLMVRAGR